MLTMASAASNATAAAAAVAMADGAAAPTDKEKMLKAIKNKTQAN